MDFKRRLLAKFRIPGGDAFWGKHFQPIPHSALYPDDDRMQALCDGIRAEVGTEVEAGQLGRFLQTWSKLEGRLMSMARQRRARVFSVREAIDLLARESVLPANLKERVDALRRQHNIAVRHPADLKPDQLNGAITETQELLSMVSSERDKSAED